MCHFSHLKQITIFFQEKFSNRLPQFWTLLSENMAIISGGVILVKLHTDKNHPPTGLEL